MTIEFNAADQTITLNTAATSYQIKISPEGVLLHTWYGEKTAGDMSYQINYRDRGFAGQIDDFGSDRTKSLDVLPQEYPGTATGDFRKPAVDLSDHTGPVGTDFRYVSHRIVDGKYSLSDLPAVYGSREQAQTLEILVMDAVSGAEITLLYSVFPETDMITRAAVLHNAGNKRLIVNQAASASMDILHGDYDLIHFYGSQGAERQLERSRVGHSQTTVKSRRGTSSHQHSPFVMLADRKANEDYGRVWGFSLVWSGSFQASAEQDQFGQTRFSMGLDDEDFNYPLQPGQELVLPEVMMSFSSCGMEKLSHNFHDIIRGNLIRGPWKNKRRPVLLNSWETAGFDFNGDSILELADEAAATGMEMLVLDDGWFGNRNSDNEGLGDWFANTAKLGCSIKEFSKKIHDRGLMFGLWFEPEMVSEDSELYRSHPEYAMHIPGRRPVRGRNQLVLDFSHDAVVDAVYEQVTKVLDGAGIDYLKWDMNRSITDVYENGFGKGAKLYRYVLGVYRFMNKLLVRYPGLLLETCSGGGGRFDAGMLYYSPQIWCSDNTDPIERLAIQYGTSFGFPANTMGAHVGAEKNPNNGRVTELNTRAAAASAGVLGYELDLTKLSGREKKEIREQIDTYKQDWPLIDSGNYYRLDDIDRKDHHSAWMFVSENQDRAVLQVVTTDTRFKAPTEYILLKGLKKDSFYQSRESGKIYSGSALMSAGIFLPRFREEYKALKIHFEEVNA